MEGDAGLSESVAREVLASTTGPQGSSPGKKIWQQRLALLAALVAGAMLAFQWDLPVARWVHAHRAPGIVREFFEAAEYYGHAVGTLLIIVTVGVLDPAKKRLLPWLLAASLGAGLTADVAKQLIERQRPRELDLANIEITTTITSVLPFLEGKVASHSFPSGHTATAFGLTVALSTLYRRGKTWFVILACLVGVQRVQSLSHFPSDVLAGAAIGLLVGWLIADWKLKDAC